MRWRFVHAADLHLDSPLRNLEAKADGGSGASGAVALLRPATRRAFARLVDTCIEERASFLLLAGDLYDRDCPNMQIAIFLRTQLVRLRDAGVRVVMVLGNHDADNKITSGLPRPDNTSLLSARAAETVLLDDLPVPVAIHGQSFKPGPVTDNLAARFPAALAGRFNVGLLHTSLEGNTEHAAYAPCSRGDLEARGYGYWALGHIHKSAVLQRDPWIVYPGNLQGRHARETGPKGCFIVEMDDDRVVDASHRALDVIRWQHVQIEAGGAATESALLERAQAGLRAAWAACDDRPGAFRVTIAGVTGLHGDLLGRPRRWRQSLLELSEEIGGGDIWLEALRVETQPPAREHDAGTARGAHAETIGSLLEIVREIASDPNEMGELVEEVLGPLRSRLPDDVRDQPAIAAMHELRDPELARRMAERLEPLMAARLAGTGDAGEEA